ncbi:MAG: ABC transporter ATP-binding protein [Clostridia bacterium]
MKNIKFIIGRIKKYIGRYIIGTLFLAIYIFLNLELVKILGSTIDMLNVSSINSVAIMKNVKAIIILTCMYAALVFVWRPLIYSAAKKVKKDLNEKIYKHLCKVPFEYYLNKTNGDMLSYLHNDVEYIENLLSEKYIIIASNFFTTIITLIYMFNNVDIKLSAITAVIIAVSYVIVFLLTKGLSKSYEDARELKLKNSTKIQQMVYSIKTIKMFNRVEEFVDNFRKHASRLETQEMGIIKKNSFATFFVSVYSEISFACMLVYSGMLVLNSEISIGKFVEFTTYLGLISLKNLKVTSVITDLKQINVSVNKIRKFLRVKDEEDYKPRIPLDGSRITLKKLTVNPYVNEGVTNNILSNVSFELDKGEALGIVGRVGSGKSTLVNVLSEIYTVENNMILIDKIDINKISKDSTRDIVEIVTEENYVFSDSIFNNVTFFKDNYTYSQVEEACKKSLLHNQIKRMYQKYDTQIGENGIQLTTGQKQKLRIARSFLTNKKIIIYDECFSGIDNATCDKIMDNIQKYLRDKIIIIISNNINNVKWCDKIIVMEDGKIVEKGTHNSLIKEENIYSRMYEFQKKMNGV